MPSLKTIQSTTCIRQRFYKYDSSLLTDHNINSCTVSNVDSICLPFKYKNGPQRGKEDEKAKLRKKKNSTLRGLKRRADAMWEKWCEVGVYIWSILSSSAF